MAMHTFLSTILNTASVFNFLINQEVLLKIDIQVRHMVFASQRVILKALTIFHHLTRETRIA